MEMKEEEKESDGRKGEVNEASVKTKVRMTDNRDAQQRRQLENTELCVCMSAICAHFRESLQQAQRKQSCHTETNRVSNSHKIGYR